MNKDNIAPDRFITGYDEAYKIWLKNDIQSISSPVPNSCRTVEDKEAKVVIELREVKWEAQEIHFDEPDLWVEDNLDEMQYQDWEEKGLHSKGYLLMLWYTFQQHKTQESSTEAGPSGSA